MSANNKILILYAHPTAHKSKINSRLLEEIKNIENVTIRSLYHEYPNFYINVKKEQEIAEQHDIIIFQFPLYWYSAPSLLKEWLDLVLEHGWAFGSKGNALKGKKFLIVTTTGGSAEAYTEGGHNHFTINQILTPFKATANLCKMITLPPFVVFGGLLITPEKIDASADKYKRILISLRDNNFSKEELNETECINYLLD